MALPYFDYSENFEGGDFGNMSETADTDNKLDVLHIAELAQTSVYQPTPLRGAYALVADCRKVPSGGWNDSYLTEADGFDEASVGNNVYFGFSFLITPDMEANHADEVSLFRLVDSSTDGDIYVQYSDIEGWRVGIYSSSVFDEDNAVPFELGEWVHVAGRSKVGSGSNGEFELWVNGERVGDANSGTANAAVTAAQIGPTNMSGTMKGGLIIFDELVGDDTNRPYPLGEFDADTGTSDPDPIGTGTAVLQDDGHVMIGGGEVVRVTVVGDGVVQLWDTDRKQQREAMLVDVIAGPASREYDEPISFERGVYVTNSAWAADEYVLLHFDPDIEDVYEDAEGADVDDEDEDDDEVMEGHLVQSAREALGEYASELQKPRDDD